MEKIISILDKRIEHLTKLSDFHSKNMARNDVDCDYGFHYRGLHDTLSALSEVKYIKMLLLETVEKADEDVFENIEFDDVVNDEEAGE